MTLKVNLDYRIIFNSISNGMAFTKFDSGKIIDVNDAWIQSTGINLENAIGKSALDLGLWAFETERMRCMTELKMQRRVVNYEATLIMKSVNLPHLISGQIVEMENQQYVLWEFRDISELKKNEVSLRESEEQFRSTFEQVTVGMAHVKTDGKFLRVNHKLCDILGYSREELLSKSFQDITYPDDLDVNVKKLQQILANDIQSFSDEKRYITKNGEIIWVNLTVSAPKRNTGTSYYMISVIEDITVRKRTEDLLKKSEEKFAKAFKISPESMIIASLEDGKYIEVNDIFLTTTGFTLDEVIGHTSTELNVWVTENDRLRYIKELSENGSLKNFKVRYRMKDNKIKDFLVSSSVFYLQGVKCSINFIKNITERKQLENIIRKSKKQYDSLVSNIPVGIYLLRSSIKKTIAFEYVSPKMEEMLAVSAESILLNPQVAFQMFHPEDKDELIRLNQEHLRILKSFDWEGRVVIKGSTKWLRINSYPELLENGEVLWNGVITDITERKLAEKLRLASELRYRRLFESAKDGILILDAETGKIVDVNPYLIEMLSYSKEQFIEKAIWEIGFFKDIVANQDNFLELQQKEYVRYEDIPLETAAGRHINVEFVSNVYLVDNHKVIQCNIRNITERKRIEEEILVQKNTLNSIFDDAPYLMILVDSDGKVININKEGVKFAGKKKADLLEQLGGDVFNCLNSFKEPGCGRNVECTNCPLRSLLTKTFNTGMPVHNEEGKMKFNVGGKEVSFDLLFSTTLVKQNNLDFVLITIVNITDRKHAEEALLESEVRYRTMIEQSIDGITIADEEGRYLTVNPAFSKMTGYTIEELLKMRLFDLLPKQTTLKLFPSLINEHKPGYREIELLKKDGTTFYALITGSSLEIGNNHYIQGIVTDITERKIAEEELEKHRNHLEELVQLRTQEWNNANEELQIQIEREKEVELILQQSLVKEKELSEMQTRFISTTSHEFRTPLSAVLSSTELLQRYGAKWNDDKKKEHYNRIIESVEYLTKLLDDVLTISRSETGKISFKSESVDLFQLISDCEKDNKSLLTEKHEFRLNYNLEEKEYNLDRKLMRFIFSNLLSNAAKYSPEGGKIEMTINQNQQQLIIEICDEGIGIPLEEVDKIFDSFYRTKNTGTIEGTGLGLAIVKRSVNLHGGEIKVKSELNKGTTFTVTIPSNVNA